MRVRNFSIFVEEIFVCHTKLLLIIRLDRLIVVNKYLFLYVQQYQIRYFIGLIDSHKYYRYKYI